MQKLNQQAIIKDIHNECTISECNKIECSFDSAGELSEKAGVEIIQLSKGNSIGHIHGLSDERSQLLRVKFSHEAAIRTELQRKKMHFTLPVQNAAVYLVNGLPAEDTSIFFNYDVDETYIHATERDSIAGNVPMDVFLNTLGLLQGREGKQVRLPPSRINLPIEAKKQLLHRLSILLYGSNSSAVTEKHTPDESLTKTIAYLLAQAASYGDYEQGNDRHLKRWQNLIFESAVKHYDENMPGTTSIANICVALGLSAPTLIKAFREMVGTTPGRYFALRRLARARKELLGGSTTRSAVKRCSLKNGFLQPGQFSAFYKSIYDEMPSMTAERSLD